MNNIIALIHYKNKINYFKNLLLSFPSSHQYLLNVLIYYKYIVIIYFLYIDNISHIMYIFIYNDLSLRRKE